VKSVKTFDMTHEPQHDVQNAITSQPPQVHLLPTHASEEAPGTSTIDGKAGHPECMNEYEYSLPEASGQLSN
jgi:hypothetical protein